MDEQASQAEVQDDELGDVHAGAEGSGIVDDVAGQGDGVAGRAGQRQAGTTGDVQRRGGAVLPDDEGAVRTGTEADTGVRAERAESVGAGLAGAGLQHDEPPGEAPDGGDPGQTEPGRTAPAGGLDRNQDAGRRRVDDQEARGGVPQAVAQGSPGDRRRNAGDPGDRGDGQRGGGCADAAGAARADSGRGGGAVGERGRGV